MDRFTLSIRVLFLALMVAGLACAADNFQPVTVELNNRSFTNVTVWVCSTNAVCNDTYSDTFTSLTPISKGAFYLPNLNSLYSKGYYFSAFIDLNQSDMVFNKTQGYLGRGNITVSDLPVAIVSNGDMTHIPLSGHVYNFVTSQGYLTAESDPLWAASASHGIASTDISHWNTAYGWGDHSTQGYIKNLAGASPLSASGSTVYLSANCAAGQVLKNQSGGWSCGDDSGGTSYSASAPWMILTGSAFSWNQSAGDGRYQPVGSYITSTAAQDQNITNLWTNASGQESRMAGHDTSIANLWTNASDQQGKFSGLWSNASAQETHISNLWTNASGQETRMAGHDTSIANLWTNASGQESRMAGHDTSISNLWTNASGQESRMAGFDTSVSNLWSNASAQETHIKNLWSNASNQDQRIGSIESNYFPKSGGTISGNVLINGNLDVIGAYVNLTVSNNYLNGSAIPKLDGFYLGAPGLFWDGRYIKNLNASLIAFGVIPDARIDSNTWATRSWVSGLGYISSTAAQDQNITNLWTNASGQEARMAGFDTSVSNLWGNASGQEARMGSIDSAWKSNASDQQTHISNLWANASDQQGLIAARLTGLTGNSPIGVSAGMAPVVSFSLSCSTGQVPKNQSGGWSCGNDNTGAGIGAGDVPVYALNSMVQTNSTTAPNGMNITSGNLVMSGFINNTATSGCDYHGLRKDCWNSTAAWTQFP